MKKIRTLIVDDEPLAREGIAMMLEGDSEVEIIGTCGDGEEALEAIRTQQPDLVYLDVQMPRLSGFEALDRLPAQKWPTVVFVTAYDDFAVKAFEAGAVGYLLKPFRDVVFRDTLSRAKQKIRYSDANDLEREKKALVEQLKELDRRIAPSRPPADSMARLAFKVGGDYVFIASHDIVWVEAQGDFIRVSAGGQIHVVREALQDVETRLDPAHHARIHRSYIVNTAHVRRIAPTLHGDYTVLMSDGAKVRLSRTFRHKLKNWLPDHFG